MSKQEKQVLILGRGVYALPLLRILGSNKSGFGVHVTLGTSVGLHDIGSFSRYVDSIVKIPRPDRDLKGFTAAVCKFARDKPNLVIIPVAEESIFLSQIADRIRKEAAPNAPSILTSSPDLMAQLNDKFLFQKHMTKVFPEEKVPRTSLVLSKEHLMEALRECFKKEAATTVVVKPIHGHGGLGTHMVRREDFEASSPEELSRRFEFSDLRAYAAQEFVEGKELSTYSLCKDGVVLAHLCYVPRSVGVHGFSPVRSMAPSSKWKNTLKWVQQVASALRLTGQFGFDFIERFNGDLVALECNPRATNGIAFFSPRFSSDIATKMQQAFLGLAPQNTDVIKPIDQHPRHIMTLLPTISCIAKAKTNMESMSLAETAVESNDDIWWWKDPLPTLIIFAVRGVVVLAYALLMTLLGRSSSVEEAIKQYIINEIVEFTAPPEKPLAAKLQTVGGLEDAQNKKKQEKGMKVLVTGATGFLGGRLVWILNQGYEDKDIKLPLVVDSIKVITATGRDEAKGQELIDSLEPKGKAKFVKADLSDAEQTYHLVQGHDVVFHCAALCKLFGPWDSFVASNTTSTENLVHACHLSGTVRLFVHVSSPSVCFPIDVGDSFGFKETDPMPPEEKLPNRYTVTKKRAETIVYDVTKRYHIPCIMLRPRAIFGPGDTTLFPLLIDALRRKRLPIIGNKKSWQDFTFVDNVVYALVCCLDKTPEVTKVYSITNDDPRYLWDAIHHICQRMKLKEPWKRIPIPVVYTFATFCEFFAVLGQLFGFPHNPLITRYSVNVLSRSSTLDITAAKKDLGYKPVVSAEEGFIRFLDSVAPEE